MASPPSPDGTMAERLHTAFPDLEELFSVEEILALWGEVDDTGTNDQAGSSSGAGPSA